MYEVYEIGYGDSINSIADKFNTTIDELKRINKDLNIEVGKNIIVPVINDDIFETYTVKSGDNLYKIAQKYNISVDDLASINGLDKNDYIYPNQDIIVPTGEALIYITKDNDTINDLKQYFKSGSDSILDQNKNIYLVPDQLVVFKKEGI